MSLSEWRHDSVNRVPVRIIKLTRIPRAAREQVNLKHWHRAGPTITLRLAIRFIVTGPPT
jgi:hypothetical protein